MSIAGQPEKLSARSARVREIARGIFDKMDRADVLKFVEDAVKLEATTSLGKSM
jgi:hypothetical protein